MGIGEQRQGSTDEVCQSQQTVLDAFQLPVISMPLQTNQMMVTGPPLLANGLTPHLPYHFAPHQIPHQQVQHHQLRRTDQQLRIFWANQLQEIRAAADFKNHNLPLARIKKIMKADEDVKMIAAETPMLFSRACEMFILELTYRSWAQAEHGKRRTLQRSDISSAIVKSEVFDFLVDIVPMEELKDSGVSPVPGGEELNDSIPYFCDPSKFGPLMMDMSLPEMDSHSLQYIQQYEDCMIQQMQEKQHTT